MTTPELEILYDNGPCLVVNKPAGVLTQAPAGIDSLEVRVKAFYREREQKEGNIYLGLPHRLDRPVSGAIVFARHVRAAQRLVDAVRKSHGDEGLLGGCRRRRSAGRRHVDRPPAQAARHAAIDRRAGGRSARQDCRHALSRSRRGSKASARGWRSNWKPAARIRFAFSAASRSHPVIGDAQYGSTRPFGEQFEDERLRAIALHARQLGFNHPMTNEPVDVIAPMPPAWES